MRPNTLTPEGAALLRQVRDHIVKHPKELDMEGWECGTTACIAGHCDRFITGQFRRKAADFHLSRVARYLGWEMDCDAESLPMPLYRFFLLNLHHKDVAERINRFLWAYGYPADELVASAEVETCQTA